MIINAVSADADMDALIGTLKKDGALVFVGLPVSPQRFTVGPLVFGRKVITGSYIGGIAQTQEMLDFCASHAIGAEVEVISADDVDDAYERVLSSDVRYRFVIDASTI